MTTIMTAVKDDDEVGFNVPHGREREGLPYAKEKGSRKERSSRLFFFFRMCRNTR
jgi:hypothetical protein